MARTLIHDHLSKRQQKVLASLQACARPEPETHVDQALFNLTNSVSDLLESYGNAGSRVFVEKEAVALRDACKDLKRLCNVIDCGGVS